MIGAKKNKDINLIPESERIVNLSSTFPILLIFGLIVVGSIVLGVIVFSLKLASQVEAEKLESNLNQKNQEWQQVASAAASLSSIKNKITAFESFKAGYPSPTIYTEAVERVLPSNVTLILLDLDNTGKGSMQVSTAEAAVAYQLVEVLAKAENFSNVKLESITKASEEEGYTVNLTFKVSK